MRLAKRTIEYMPEQPTDRQTWLEYLQEVTQGMSRKDIAEIADIDPSGLTRWFGGRRPSAEKVIAFARGLHQPPIEGLIAAGYLEPREVAGVIEVKRSRRDLSDSELLIELGERLAERPARARVDEITERMARPETPASGMTYDPDVPGI